MQFSGRISGLQMYGAPQRGQESYDSSVRSFARRGLPEPSGYGELALREHNQIRGNDFTDTELVQVFFRFGVDLTAQKLPAREDYLYLPDAETAVLRAVASLEGNPTEVADSARDFLIDTLKHEVGRGQRQLLINPKDYERRKVVSPHVLLAIELMGKYR